MVEPDSGETPRDPREPDETVVDPAVLAERRARRAEQAQEAHARRAAETDEALATAQAELHRAHVRLERVLEDRARLDAQLAARERELRAARERAHAEERQRVEELAEAGERLERERSEAASLRRRLESAGVGELASLRERVQRADAAAARLRADLEAQLAAEARARAALESARTQLAELRRVGGPEVGEAVARRVAELRALAEQLAARLTVLEAERRTALGAARHAEEARAAAEADRDALRDEAERSASALLAARAAPAADRSLRAALDEARGELDEARKREQRAESLAREVVGTATTALTGAEARLAEAETATRTLREDLTTERARRQEADEARAQAERRAEEEGEARAEAERARDAAIAELAALRDDASMARRTHKDAAREAERARRDAVREAERAREEAVRARKAAVREAERAREDAGRARVVATAAELAAEEALAEAKKARKRTAEVERTREQLASRVARVERGDRAARDVEAEVSGRLEVERREMRSTEDRLIAELAERTRRLVEAQAALARRAPVSDEPASARLAAELRLAETRRPGPPATAAEARFAAAVLPAPSAMVAEARFAAAVLPAAPPPTDAPISRSEPDPPSPPPAPAPSDAGLRPEGLEGAASAGRERFVSRPAAAIPPAVAPGPGWLGRAAVEIAGRDPTSGAALLLGLLPLHGLAAKRAVDYDLVLDPGGTWRVVVVPGALAEVSELTAPRGRKEIDLRLETDAPALAAALGGANARQAKRAGELRTKGSRRAARATLRSLADAPLDLPSAARAGLYLPPPLAYLPLARAVLPGWTGGWRFVVAHELVGQGGGTWYLHVDGAAPLRVAQVAQRRPAATVRCSTAAFVPMLAEQATPGGEKVGLRGDVAAIALLRRWVAGAQEGSLPTP